MNRKQLISLWCGIGGVVVFGSLLIWAVRCRNVMTRAEAVVHYLVFAFIVALATGLLIISFEGNKGLTTRGKFVLFILLVYAFGVGCYYPWYVGIVAWTPYLCGILSLFFGIRWIASKIKGRKER